MLMPPAIDTPIGRTFRGRTWRLALGSITALAIVTMDMALLWHHDFARALPPLAAILIYGCLGGWDPEGLGLRLRPRQGVGYWVRVSLLAGGMILAFIVVAGAGLYLAGWPVTPPATSPEDALRWAPQACIYAPLVEEGIYRLALCVPLVAILRPWGAVAASWAAFAALHFVYGNPGLDNFIAGLFLAWAFLKSGSILVPVTLHALGNLFVIGCHVAFWWLR